MRQSGGKVKVVREMQRADYLQEHLGGIEAELAQLSLPGMEAADSVNLTAIDRLHLLVVLDQRGVLTGGLIARWGEDHTFVELARRVARYLDPENKSQKVYQRIADALSGRGMIRLV